MAWWGKMIGGAFGFILGGGSPLGILLGAAFGHQFDKGLTGVMRDEAFSVGNQERVQAAFFTATFSVMGNLAKADGQVSEHEISLARSVMSQMQLSAEQRKAAMHLFNDGKKADFALDDVVEQFRRECHRRRNLIQMFLEIQLAIAMADGVLDKAEKKLLLHISELLGFSRSQFERLLDMVRAQQHYAGGQAPGTTKPSLKDAYAVLGVAKTAKDADVKKAYRRLMSQHHPDKLVSKGLPEEMMELAKEKTQEISMAYNQIKESRGF